MTFETNLYFDMQFCGFHPFDDIEEHLAEYQQKAEELAKIIDWDEVVLYAIFLYDSESHACISADFMLLRLDYSRYLRLCKKISPDCRLYIKRNCY